MAGATFTATFSSTGTYTWTCPAGVTSASWTCNGSSTFNSSGTGSGSVTAGTGYTVSVVSNASVVVTWSMTSPAVIAANTSGGTYTWTAPAGTTSVSAQCWAAGGGGGGGNASFGGAGGGGGEYAAELTDTVVSGDAYTFVVGAAGPGGSSGNAGTAGGNTTFSGTSATTVTANGGGGGSQATGSGGAGGTGSSNSVHHNGGTGGTDNSETNGAGGGGSGGTSAAGNTGGGPIGGSGGSGASAVTGGGPGGNGATSGTGSAPASGPGGGGGAGAVSSAGGPGFDGQVTLTWTAVTSSPDMPQIRPGPTWLDIFKPGLPRPRPPVPPSGPYYGNLPNPSDVREIQPGPSWLDHFKPGLPRPRPQVPDAGAYTGPVSATGSMALAPLAITSTGAGGNTTTSGSMALAPLAMQATDIETFASTGSMALAPLVLAASGLNQPSIPPGPVELLVELNVNGTWVDISDYVYQRDNIVISRGRPDEGSTGTGTPAQMTLTLDNRDGRFSSQYPLSPYYPYLGRNVQLRISAPLTMPPPFDLGYRFWGEVSEWPPSWDPTGTDVYSQITVSGIFRRLTQSAALKSAMTRYLSMLGVTPLAWWPAEDGTTATQIASGLPKGLPMRWTGTPSLASDSGFTASGPAPACGSAIFTGDTGVSGALPVASFASYTVAGTYEWTAPPNVTEVLVTCVGGGAPGGPYNASTGGGGGGGGEYASDSVAVTPGDTYTVVVGSGSDGGNSTFDSTSVVANGGTAGDDSGNGGAGGTGSTNATHFDGGAGADGSGGSGTPGSSTSNNQVFDSSTSWDAPSDIDGSVTAYVWGAGGGGGGGAGGGSPNGGGGGAGGNFNYGSVAVTGGSSYTVSIGSGGSGGSNGPGSAGGASSFTGDSQEIAAFGGNGGAHSGTGGTPTNTGSPYTKGGSGGNASQASPYKGGGGGGGASLGGNGGNGAGSDGGAGGNSGGLESGGTGAGGATTLHGNGIDANQLAAGGGGSSSDSSTGGHGGTGQVWLFWTESTSPGAAAVGGGGGSSGGSASAGNDGATEAGGAAVDGGGPGGGQLAGSVFNAAPVTGPGGGGGGFDSLGGPGDGADGTVVISYAASGSGDSGTTANVLRFGLHIPSGGDTNDGVVAQMYTTGTISYIQVIYTTGGNLTLSGFSGAGAQLFTTGAVAFGCDGLYLWVSAELQQSGSNVTYNLTAIEQGGTEPITSGSGTYDGASLGDPFLVQMDPTQNMAFAWDQLLLLEDYYSITDDAAAFAAHAGETAAARVTRLCTEQGISSAIIDAGDSDTTALMGPQTADKLISLLQTCEDADRGLIYEPRDSFGITYRSRASLYNQAQQVIYDYSQAMLAQPIQPTEDDQLTRNDVTVTRLNGSSYEAIVGTGRLSIQDPPDGVGQYTYSLTAVVQSDGQLPDTASWIAWVGTQSDLRYPQITINLFRGEVTALFADTVSADIGDYLQVIKPPFWLPTGTIDQLAYGYSETINALVWTIAFNNVPESAYEVCDAGTSRSDTDGSTLGTGIGTADTSFQVITPVPNQPWITLADYPDEFPFNIVVAPAVADGIGEVMTVSEIDNSTSPQTFIVERGINGVVLAHGAGESVNTYQPAITAL